MTFGRGGHSDALSLVTDVFLIAFRTGLMLSVGIVERAQMYGFVHIARLACMEYCIPASRHLSAT
jgi:hypothetical protein